MVESMRWIRFLNWYLKIFNSNRIISLRRKFPEFLRRCLSNKHSNAFYVDICTDNGYNILFYFNSSSIILFFLAENLSFSRYFSILSYDILCNKNVYRCITTAFLLQRLRFKILFTFFFILDTLYLLPSWTAIF